MRSHVAASSRPPSTAPAWSQNSIHDRRVELLGPMLSSHRDRRVDAATTAEDLERAGELDEAGRQADLGAAELVRLALAVPLLVRLTDGGGDRRAKTDLLGELAAQRGVRRQERDHRRPARHRKDRHALGPLRGPTMGSEPADEERDRLGRVHAEHLEAVALESDVVAEPLGLLRGVGVAIRVHHQAQVIGRLPLAVIGTDQFSQSQRDHRLAHAVVHRLPEPEVSGVGQRGDELGDPNPAPVAPVEHERTLRPPRTVHGPPRR